MATLELDAHTVEQLHALAAASGMTAEAYLKLLFHSADCVRPVPKKSAWHV